MENYRRSHANWPFSTRALPDVRCAPNDDARRDSEYEEAEVTLLWFVVWLICNLIGDREALTFDPVNWWAGTLVLAAALDLGRQHTGDMVRRPSRG